jgi:hypothetical protein
VIAEVVNKLADQTLTGWIGQHTFQIGYRGVQLGLQSLQLPRWVGIGTGDGAEVVTLRHPGLDREEQRGRVGVAARPWHAHVAGTQPGLHSVQHAQFPVVAVGGGAALAAGGFDVAAPPDSPCTTAQGPLRAP